MPIIPDKIKESRGEHSQGWLAFEISMWIRRHNPDYEPLTGATVGNWERGVCEPRSLHFDALCAVTNKAPSFFYGEKVDGLSTHQQKATEGEDAA